MTETAPDRSAIVCRLSRRQVLRSSTAALLLTGSGLAAVPGVARAEAGDAVELKVVMADGRRTYNGKVPGPTIRTRAGETLRVAVENALDPETEAKDICPDHTEHNKPHGANVTNLHTHGLHVSPGKSQSGRDSDNIFLSHFPTGQTFPDICSDAARDDRANWRVGTNEYEFDLPETHPSGTFWYHAHKHGSTAGQVGDGMAGPLIVEDPPGYMPEYIESATRSGREDIFMIVFEDGGHTIVRTLEAGGGEKNPTIVLNPGSVRRWRFINAAPFGESFVRLNLETELGDVPIEVHQIAFDGLTLKERVPVRPTDTGDPWENHAALAPGNRTDFVIRVRPDTPPAEFRVVAQEARPEILHAEAGAALRARAAVLTVRIEGAALNDPWSTDTALPGPGLPDIAAEGAVARSVEFGRTSEGFVIDGEKFTGTVKQPAMVRGTVGEWTVRNSTGGTHPFHIHVNPFFVTHINGEELGDGNPLRRWQDTIALPSKDGDRDGEVRFLTRFERFTGKFVIHCHILPHEDGGMMQAVEVVA